MYLGKAPPLPTHPLSSLHLQPPLGSACQVSPYNSPDGSGEKYRGDLHSGCCQQHQGAERGQTVRAAAAPEFQLQLQRRDGELPHGRGQVQGRLHHVRGHRGRARQARRHLRGHICSLMEDPVWKSHRELPPHWQKDQQQPSGFHLAPQR